MKIADDIAHFDEAALNWDQEPRRLELALAISRAIKERLSEKKLLSIMDYGCGTGLLGFNLKDRAESLIFADISSGMLEVLSGKIKALSIPARALPLDLETDPVPEFRVDLIVSQMALHHIRDTKKILEGFYRILLPGGRIALADLDFEGGVFHATPVPHPGFHREALSELAASVGFARVTTQTAHVIQKPDRTDTPKDFPVFLLVAEKPPKTSDT